MKKTAVITVSVALAGCAVQQDKVGSAHGMTFSDAEMAAFVQTNARLNYASPYLGYDGSGCARYIGTASNGRVRSELLRDASYQPICDSSRAGDFISRWLLDSR